MKVEIRIKTKNEKADIIKQKHGKADRGKKVPTSACSQSAIKLALADFCVITKKPLKLQKHDIIGL
ncbi:MAG: hypothetical protein NTX36_04035 [Proteobacteria bacterium]|nr:hypothetical protein [Pseudomonadota bacterium]